MPTFHIMVKKPHKKLVLSEEALEDGDGNPKMNEQNEIVKKVVFARIGNNLREDRKPVFDEETGKVIEKPTYFRLPPEVNIFTMIGDEQPSKEKGTIKKATKEQFLEVVKLLDKRGDEHTSLVMMSPEEFKKLDKKKK